MLTISEPLGRSVVQIEDLLSFLHCWLRIQFLFVCFFSGLLSILAPILLLLPFLSFSVLCIFMFRKSFTGVSRQSRGKNVQSLLFDSISLNISFHFPNRYPIRAPLNEQTWCSPCLGYLFDTYCFNYILCSN